MVWGSVVLWAQLRIGDTDPQADVLAARQPLLPALRKRCPRARIFVRGDSGLCRDEGMNFCASQDPVEYVLGLAKHSVLVERVQRPWDAAAAKRCLCGLSSAREFTQFEYQTHKSWSRSRRGVAKAETLAQGNNPRFVVTSLPAAGFKEQEKSADRFAPQRLYEQVYGERGNRENVLKQQVLGLPADRLSPHYLASNQLRLGWATLAYLLLERLPTLTLGGTELAHATAGTIRLKLLKVAAAVTVSVRRVYVQLCSAFPLQSVFRTCQERWMNLLLGSG